MFTTGDSGSVMTMGGNILIRIMKKAEAAVLGMKTPEKAMADLANRVRPLLG